MRARRKHYLLIVISVFSAAICGLILFRPSSPAGRYVASKNIGAVGDWYWEFADGKVALVVHEPDTKGGTVMVRDDAGVYYKTNGSWVYFAGAGAPQSGDVPIRLESSWFGVTLYTTNSSSEFWRRRLIAGERPRWMLRLLPWSIQ